MYNYMVMSDITLPTDPCPAATGAGLFYYRFAFLSEKNKICL